MASQPGAMMVISYDDGPQQDYSAAFPVHRRLGVPAELNVVADLVGAPGFLSAKQLAEMQRAGFEIVSHTSSHKTLAPVPLARPAHPGDAKLYVRKPSQLVATECRIGREDAAEVVRTLGEGEDAAGPYLALAAPLRGRHAGGTTMRLTEAAAEHELAHSRRALEAMGLSVASFTYPFCDWDDSSRRLVAAHYASARACGHDALNPWQSMDPYALNASDCMFLSPQQLSDLFDAALARRALLILMTHTWADAFSPGKLESLLREAIRRGIEVVARRDALAALHGSSAG